MSLQLHDMVNKTPEIPFFIINNIIVIIIIINIIIATVVNCARPAKLKCAPKTIEKCGAV